VSARYFSVLVGWDITGGSCMVLAGFFLCLTFIINALSPKVAGQVQVGTTVVKLIPLVLMAVMGLISGLRSGLLAENFSAIGSVSIGGGGLMGAVVAVAFAYEGWIIATSINAELKDPKRTLPLALIIGSLIIVAVYLGYYVGLGGAVTTAELMASGEAAAKMAFQHMFGSVGGTMMYVLIIISCLGVTNGLMLACCRGMYALAVRGEGLYPQLFSQVDPVTKMPTNSCVAGLLFSSNLLFFARFLYAYDLINYVQRHSSPSFPRIS